MRLITRLAIPLALLAGAVVFLIAFALLREWGWALPLAVLAASGLFLVTSFSTWLMADSRTRSELQQESYAEEAEASVREALARLKAIRAKIPKVRHPPTVELLHRIDQDTQRLFGKVRERNPNDLLSSATAIGGHLQNLDRVLTQYIEIQEEPRYYEEPMAKLEAGQEAIAGFEEFLTKSIRLIEAGDIAGYNVSLKMLEATKYSALT